MKFLAGLIFLFLGGYTILFWGSGNHGHFIFRPHQLEDWLFFGLAFVFLAVAVLMFYKFFKKNNPFI